MARAALWVLVCVFQGANPKALIAQEIVAGGVQSGSNVKRLEGGTFRKYYITRSAHQPADALTACAVGYHMASYWELLDPSNLQYDTVLGFTTGDSGFGPPASNEPGGIGSTGWIRTGWNASGAGENTAGQANCNGWTNNTGAYWGSHLEIGYGGGSGWNTSSNFASPWQSLATNGCSALNPVWCIEDYDPAPRRYYITQTTHDGNDALTACSVGYHMASLWEVADTSNMEYDIGLGLAADDSGSGPPTTDSSLAWIRTGFAASNANENVPGHANCHAWTQSSNSYFGSTAKLDNVWWSTSRTVITPWVSTAANACGSLRPVWCVGNYPN
jgi:hypothetical protein